MIRIVHLILLEQSGCSLEVEILEAILIVFLIPTGPPMRICPLLLVFPSHSSLAAMFYLRLRSSYVFSATIIFRNTVPAG